MFKHVTFLAVRDVTSLVLCMHILAANSKTMMFCSIPPFGLAISSQEDIQRFGQPLQIPTIV